MTNKRDLFTFNCEKLQSSNISFFVLINVKLCLQALPDQTMPYQLQVDKFSEHCQLKVTTANPPTHQS